MSNNAWTRNGQATTQQVNNQQPGAPSQAAAGPAFNSQEVQQGLKSGYASIATGDRASLTYKPGSHTSNARSGGAWASNSKVMGNGKDFFNELRRQISMAQQGNERAGG